MEWLPKYNKLDPAQLEIVQRIVAQGGNHFVEGFPGTGKSVVLAHAAMRCHEQSGRACAILTYTNALVACIREGVHGVAVETIDRFVDHFEGGPIGTLFVDEAQDLQRTTYRGTPTVATLHRCAGRVVFAADSAQSLYDDALPLAEVKAQFGVDAQHNYLLRVNYRMTKKMLNVLDALFPERKIEVSTGSLVDDVDVVYGDARSQAQSYAWIFRKARDYAEPRDPAAILFATHKQLTDFAATLLPDVPEATLQDRHQLNASLCDHALPVRFVGNGVGGFSEADREGMIYLMTMHSAKGLDFKTVCVPNCQSVSGRYRNLYYVALSRARSNLFLSGFGASPVKEALGQVARIVPVTPAARASAAPETNDFPF